MWGYAVRLPAVDQGADGADAVTDGAGAGAVTQSADAVTDGAGAPTGGRDGRDIAVALGTRPEVIKLAPVIRALGSRVRLLWTGQHFDFDLAELHFQRTGIEMPSVGIAGVGGARRPDQIVAVVTALLARLDEDRPAVVVVQGDTNTTNAAAQAAHYLGIAVVHVEAGLRSWDRAMPEEINRMIVGVVADLHCCATEGNADNLRRAGVDESAIAMTGNPIVEATLDTVPGRQRQEELLAAYQLTDRGFVLATIHRPENTDDRDQLAAVLDGLGGLPWPVVFPLHPRTARRIEEFRLGDRAKRLHLLAPVDHPTFLALATRARILVSDSGGVQEEVTVLKKPLVVVRRSTERPEAVAAGFARMAKATEIAEAVSVMATDEVSAQLQSVPSPFGDGRASQRIAAVIQALADRQPRT